MKKSIQVVNNHHHQQHHHPQQQQPQEAQQQHLVNLYFKNNDDDIKQYQTSSNNNNCIDNINNQLNDNNNNNLPLIIENNNSMSSSIVDNSSIKNQLSNVNLKQQHQHQRPSKTITNQNTINKTDLTSSSSSLFASLNANTNCTVNLKGYISESSKKKIADIISDIGKFNDIEKLYLYLQLPDGSSNKEDNDAIKKTVCNAFSKKADSDVIQTYAWIKSHLEEDISVSIPKHEVYEEYKAFCEENKFEKLCVADFGKAMKHVFPHVKPRRLGQRGNSKYCYSGLKKKFLLNAPELPIIDTDNQNGNDELQQGIQKKGNVMANDIVWNIILEWVEKTFNRKFKTSIDFARFLIETQGIKTDLAGAFNNQNKILRSTNKIENGQQNISENKKHETNNKCSNINKIINCKPIELNSNNFVSQDSSVGSKVVENESMYNGILKLLINPQTVISNIPLANNVNIDLLLNNNSIQYKPITNPKSTNDEPKFCAVINDKVQSNNNVIDNSLSTPNTTGNIINVNQGIVIKKEFDEELNFINSKQLNDKNYKRQIDEKELNFMAKKRHVENISTSVHQNSVDTCELKLNDLETEALNEYLNNTNITFTDNEYNCNNNNNNTNANNNNFVKIKKILENHLSQENCTSNSDNNSALKYSNNNYSTLQNLLTKNAENNLKTTFTGTVNGNNHQQQISSPNCGHNAFSFQPITSPHNNTPTIFENSALEMNMFNNNKINNSIECKQTVNACVGPSQSSSEANSPFVSPRNTPLSRSRNNSGQSAYNNYRQTPVQNFDSGVSSISSSPFISPQSTPIPSTRMRPLDNINANARVRHSSGPGGPVNRFQMVNLMACNRSNSLSPMIINENGYSNQTTFQWPQVSLVNNVELKSDIDNQKMSVVTQTDLKGNDEEFIFNFESNNLLNKSRHRHFSNPYGGAMVKNDDDNDFKALLNRSQSVPLHQMFESETFDQKTDLNRFNSVNLLDNNGSSLMPILDDLTTVRPTNELNDITSTLDDLLTNEVIQSGQDLIVSSVQLNTDTDQNTDSNQPTSIDDLNVPLLIKDERNDFNNILINDTGVEQLQSLDAFHDCDNDFSNIELDNSINNYEFST